MPEQFYDAATYQARDSVGYLVRRLYSIMRTRLEAAFAHHGLTLMQWILLMHIRDGLARTRFRLLPCEGTYFQVADYTAMSDESESSFAQWLTREIGVAAIPMSAFHVTPTERRCVRFCFAKRDETLRDAIERLARL